MIQLSAQDTAFVHLERPNSPWNGGVVMVYDRGSAAHAVTFEDVLEHFARRLHLVDALRMKLVRVPGDLDRPYWVEDPHLDLEYHMNYLALPPPGDWHRFCLLVSRLIARPLDMTRPVWQLYMIDGLDAVEHFPKGSFAVVLKVHHSALDGAAFLAIMDILHSTDPSGAPPPQADTPRRVESEPSMVNLLARAGLHATWAPIATVQALTKAGPGFGRVAVTRLGRLRTRGSEPPTHTGKTPRFGGRVGPHRAWGACFFDLADTKPIRAAVEGATVTDVAASVFGGALRTYLGELGELPAEPINAGVPVDVHAEGDRSGLGNQLSTMYASLATDIEDPLERLAAVRASTQAAKAGLARLGARPTSDLLEIVPETALSTLTWVLGALPGGLVGALPVSTAVTGRPGPPNPVYLCGAELVHLCAFGPVTDGLRLINIVNSYRAELGLFFTADRDALPDPERYEQCIRDAFNSLGDAAKARQPLITVSKRPKGTS